MEKTSDIIDLEKELKIKFINSIKVECLQEFYYNNRLIREIYVKSNKNEEYYFYIWKNNSNTSQLLLIKEIGRQLNFSIIERLENEKINDSLFSSYHNINSEKKFYYLRNRDENGLLNKSKIQKIIKKVVKRLEEETYIKEINRIADYIIEISIPNGKIRIKTPEYYNKDKECVSLVTTVNDLNMLIDSSGQFLSIGQDFIEFTYLIDNTHQFMSHLPLNVSLFEEVYNGKDKKLDIELLDKKDNLSYENTKNWYVKKELSDIVLEDKLNEFICNLYNISGIKKRVLYRKEENILKGSEKINKLNSFIEKFSKIEFKYVDEFNYSNINEIYSLFRHNENLFFTKKQYYTEIINIVDLIQKESSLDENLKRLCIDNLSKIKDIFNLDKKNMLKLRECYDIINQKIINENLKKTINLNEVDFSKLNNLLLEYKLVNNKGKKKSLGPMGKSSRRRRPPK